MTSFLIACGGDDEDESIAGTYTITFFSSTGCMDPVDNITFDFSTNDGCTTLLGVEVCGDGTMTLTEGGTFTISLTVSGGGQSFNTSATGNYTVDGNTITVCEDDGSSCETATFSLGSGELTITVPDPDDTCVYTFRGEKI